VRFSSSAYEEAEIRRLELPEMWLRD